MTRRRGLIAAWVWIVTAPCACAPATPSIFELPVPSGPQPPVAQRTDVAEDEPAERGANCSMTLHVDDMNANSSSCVIDERVRGKPGELHYACGGGSADAAFGAARFRGSVRDGLLEMSLSTEFNFTDGCRWTSQQRIRGSIKAGSLEYTYSEAPAPGQSGCDGACTAHGTVHID